MRNSFINYGNNNNRRYIDPSLFKSKFTKLKQSLVFIKFKINVDIKNLLPIKIKEMHIFLLKYIT